LCSLILSLFTQTFSALQNAAASPRVTILYKGPLHSLAEGNTSTDESLTQSVLEGRDFEDLAVIQTLCNQSAGKAKLYCDKSDESNSPDIVHLACHTQWDDKSVLDYSGIDVDGESPLDVDGAASQICLWSRCCAGGEDKQRTLLVFFNACFSAAVGRGVIKKIREKFKFKPPYILAWEEEVPNALCNKLAKAVYSGGSVSDWDSTFQFETFFELAVATIARKSKFVVNLSEPIRGEGTLSKEKMYTPTLLSPDGKDSNNLMEMDGMDNGIAVVDATPVADTGKKIEESDIEQYTKTQPRYKIMHEPIKSWIERAVFGKPVEPVELEQWLCGMKLRDDEKKCVLETLKTLEFDEMDLVDAMEDDDLADFKKQLEGSSVQVLTCKLL
jgi:hypothetical protein